MVFPHAEACFLTVRIDRNQRSTTILTARHNRSRNHKIFGPIQGLRRSWSHREFDITIVEPDKSTRSDGLCDTIDVHLALSHQHVGIVFSCLDGKLGSNSRHLAIRRVDIEELAFVFVVEFRANFDKHFAVGDRQLPQRFQLNRCVLVHKQDRTIRQTKPTSFAISRFNNFTNRNPRRGLYGRS